MNAPSSTRRRKRNWGAAWALVLALTILLASAHWAARNGATGWLLATAWLTALIALAVWVAGVVQIRRHARSLDEHTAMLEQLASELTRANRAKGEFLANVSHELRTPLAAIVGFVEMLRDGAYGELTPRQTGPVERIESSAGHLQDLVNDILDLSKLAAARMDLQLERVALRAFVLDVATELESLLTEKGLGLSISVGTTLPRLRTDPAHLRQILVNLVGNAIKYTPHGSVAIRARVYDATRSPADRASLPARLWAAHGVWIALAVHDSGIGIAPEDRERVFEEFEQVNAGPRGDSVRRGTGLGLSIARRFARHLGGDITVESAVGVGSVFTLWLPVDPGDILGDTASP